MCFNRFTVLASYVFIPSPTYISFKKFNGAVRFKP